MKSYTLRPDIFTLNFNLLFQVRSVVDTKTGCKGCPTCVNLKTKTPTTVPVCFTEPSKCAMPMLQVREEKGEAGEAREARETREE